MKRWILLGIATASLTGCFGDKNSDLKAWMQEQSEGLRGRVEPLPEVKPYEPFTYNAFDLPDPFKPSKMELAKKGTGSGIAPNANRVKEILESYDLEKLRMVGTLQQGKNIQALVKAPDGNLYRVKLGNIIAKTQAEVAGQNAPRTLDARNAFIMTSMMGDVIKMGTATKAKVLGRNDMAGKTGTTNDAFDAWFAGFTPQLVAITWIGFDQPRSLGARETGGAAALPVWINFMSSALKDVPEVPKVVPDGIISKTTETENGPITEYYLQEYPNTNAELGLSNSSEGGDSQPLGEIKELLF